MSGPAKSATEIEDVLASIRRLVSESHGGPAPALRPVSEPPKLVLTQAQRVTEPDDPWAPVPAADALGGATGQSGTDTPDDPAWGLEDRLADWGEIEGSAQEAVEDALAEQADPTPPSPLRALRADPWTEPAGDHPEMALFESETGDADWPDPGASRALRDLALVRGAADAKDEEPQTKPDTTIAVSVDDSAPTIALEAGESALDHERMTETAAETGSGAPEAGEAGYSRVFSRRIEVRRSMEALGPTPDRAASAAEGTGLPADAAEADEGGDEVDDLGDDSQLFAFPDTDDGFLDEETLREMIAEVVRQELQGALGQRITRNVRKMVRREIRLALAAQDLE